MNQHGPGAIGVTRVVVVLLVCCARVWAAGGDQVGVVFLEPVAGSTTRPGDLPLLHGMNEKDPRVTAARHMIDNEAARFLRQLLARVWAAEGVIATGKGDPPPLLISIEHDAGRAQIGLRLLEGGKIETFPRTPYLRLDETPERFSLTLLHEGARLIHMLARGGTAVATPWTALPHSTFAVTDPITALDEGFATHMETMWGHFGSDPGRTGFYHRTAPSFESATTLDAEFFFPARDLLNFTQNFAHYASVRDGLPAFDGVVQDGSYLRSIYDPARNRAALRRPNAMIACEGVCASILFWTATTWAIDAGAQPGRGLSQPGVLQAELNLVRMLAAPSSPPRPMPGEPFRPDIVDVIVAAGPARSLGRRQAVARFIDMTRGVTCRPELRQTWSSFYGASLGLDQTPMLHGFNALETAREEILDSASVDDEALREGLGPVIPVHVSGQNLEIRGLGARFPLAFDLNAMGEAEMRACPRMDRHIRQRISQALDKGPFTSLDDFADRVGVQPEELDLIPSRLTPP